MTKFRFSRLLILFLLFSLVLSLVFLDKVKLDQEFSDTKVFLEDARIQALIKDETITIRFFEKKITSSTGRMLAVPRLRRVRYDTTQGPDMIIFNGHGTSRYNTRIHGGDLSFTGLSGLFQRNIAVNCTGYVSEGLYPE